MKKISVISVLLCLCLLLPSSVFATVSGDSTRPGNIAVQTGSNSIDATIPVLGTQQIVQNADSVFMYEYHTGTLMYAWNADKQVYPSSLVKIMTALIAIEKGTMSSEVTVDQATLGSVPYDAVSVDLQLDETLRLEDLIYCMMVGSANDAAAAIATHIAGNQDAFVQLMNERARELGCLNTNFTNPHGIHDDQQYSTARDLARILCAAMELETFKTIFGVPSYTVAPTNKSGERVLSSRNYMIATDTMQIYYDERVTGGRTGEANDGTRCLAVSAESAGMKLISIVLGSESITDENDKYTIQVYGGFNETKALLDAGFNGFKSVQILYEDQALKQLPVDSGRYKVSVGPQTSASVILPENIDGANLTYEYVNVNQKLKTPITKGQKLSIVRVWNGGICIAQADLFALHSVNNVDQHWDGNTNQVWDDVLNVAGKVGIIVLIVALVAGVIFAIVVFVIRFVKKSAAQNRIRKYRRGHRRSR